MHLVHDRTSSSYACKTAMCVPRHTPTSYTKRKVVGVGIEVRSHGNAERARHRYRKWWVLKNVTFTLGFDWVLVHPDVHLPFHANEINLHF